MTPRIVLKFLATLAIKFGREAAAAALLKKLGDTNVEKQ